MEADYVGLVSVVPGLATHASRLPCTMEQWRKGLLKEGHSSGERDGSGLSWGQQTPFPAESGADLVREQ